MATRHVREKGMHTTISSARLERTLSLACARTTHVVNGPSKVWVTVWTSPVLATSGSMSKRRLLAEGSCAAKMLNPMWVEGSDEYDGSQQVSRELHWVAQLLLVNAVPQSEL